mmetsp:Transcript_166910/g.535799  ORF Transcript_166910/g.535799 Transcript_166910/m.535799 type:complete len:342 (-) Transcript_166910:344-1369(-)
MVRNPVLLAHVGQVGGALHLYTLVEGLHELRLGMPPSRVPGHVCVLRALALDLDLIVRRHASEHLAAEVEGAFACGGAEAELFLPAPLHGGGLRGQPLVAAPLETELALELLHHEVLHPELLLHCQPLPLRARRRSTGYEVAAGCAVRGASAEGAALQAVAGTPRRGRRHRHRGARRHEAGVPLRRREAQAPWKDLALDLLRAQPGGRRGSGCHLRQGHPRPRGLPSGAPVGALAAAAGPASAAACAAEGWPAPSAAVRAAAAAVRAGALAALTGAAAGAAAAWGRLAAAAVRISFRMLKVPEQVTIRIRLCGWRFLVGAMQSLRRVQGLQEAWSDEPRAA